MKILLTAFEPFGGEKINPAQEAVKLIPDHLDGAEIIKLTAPTVFGAAGDTVASAIREIKPDAVVCVGQAGGRTGITPERVAINIEDATIPDNAGVTPADRPILPNGPAAYFATLPVKAMVQAIRDIGLPASLSNSAGTFVCNHLMFRVLHLLNTECPGIWGGFIHVPFLPEQAAAQAKPTPSMELTDIVRGLEAALIAVSQHLGKAK
jgi:pyroglutamyl-peptidase